MASDRERYSEAIERCRAMARAAQTAELQQVWITIAESYVCLHHNEVRTEADGHKRWQNAREHGSILPRKARGTRQQPSESEH